jgi:hypothetical protein
MAIARSNRIRLVYTAVTVAASAIVLGSGGAVSAASHAANVGQPPPEWGENAGSWPAHNYDLSNSRDTTRTPINSQTVVKLKEKWHFDFKGERIRRVHFDPYLPQRHRLPPRPELERLRARPLERRAIKTERFGPTGG